MKLHYAGLAAALLPGLVRTTPREEDVSASDLFAGIDVSEQLIEQVEVLPGQRWVMVDICQNLVFVQGYAEPYRCPEGIEIAHLCMVLNAYRAGGDNGWIKCQTLIEDMTTVHSIFFGTWWETSPETLARRIDLLAESHHPLGDWIVSESGCCGGYALRTPWARSMTA